MSTFDGSGHLEWEETLQVFGVVLLLMLLLEPKAFEAYYCRSLLDLSLEETGAHLGIKRGAIRNRMKKAYGFLNKHIPSRDLL